MFRSIRHAAAFIRCVLLICLAGGCGRQASSDPKLIGDWETDRTLGQLGESITRYTFRANGSYEVSTTLIQARQELSAAGDFRTEGNRLIDTGPNGTNESTYSFDGETLIIEEADGDIFRLKRKEGI